MSIMAPTQKTKWSVYGTNVNVRVPQQVDTYLSMQFGENWRVPDVEDWQLECSNVDDSDIREWMKLENGSIQLEVVMIFISRDSVLGLTVTYL